MNWHTNLYIVYFNIRATTIQRTARFRLLCQLKHWHSLRFFHFAKLRFLFEQLMKATAEVESGDANTLDIYTEIL